MTRWIFVTGGVLSGLGKGLVSASIAKLLESRGYDVVPIKCDGYLNVDAGTMNPHEHGEVYVLDDGGEVDMDFGHYERFLDLDGRQDWNLTSGKIFQQVIKEEREGEFLGETVQMVPHVTDEIKQRFREAAEDIDADIAIVEVGGTVGDIENMLYLEAIRQMTSKEDTALIHLTLVPYLASVGEQKTKPTQHSVKDLQRAGLSPDLIIGRSEDQLEEAVKEKIALFCDVEKDAVISNPDIDNIYRLPLLLGEEGADEILIRTLGMKKRRRNLEDWKDLVDNMENPKDEVKVALCGKYTEIDDTYFSVEEALKHAGAHLKTNVRTELVDTEKIESIEEARVRLASADAVIIPGGFGERGTEGMITVAEYCREYSKPLLGICFGMQMMVVEFARHVADLDGAHSTEIDDETPHPVIDILPDQEDQEKKGGTMRLGSYTAELEPRTKVEQLYGYQNTDERHRHRYEVNPDYVEELEAEGLTIAGRNVDSGLTEFVEIGHHPYYIGTQAHPEFKSGLEDPHPLFIGLLEAALGG
ncbi:MAG: CTP synthase [Candidatus Nanohaloarchaea archaeon]|nr:CTP synthase [Candidatus Nanohaloarchaea archaeon]